MRKLQAQYRNDRTKLNEEMMKLYQEHKVNPLSSCLPLLAQMPVFIIMFRILYGLTFRPSGGHGSAGPGHLLGSRPANRRGGRLPPPLHLPRQRVVPVPGRPDTRWCRSASTWPSRRSPPSATDFGTGLIYLGLVVVLGVLYFVQQRMVAARAAVSPTMSPAQQKLMQYLPVAFAVFQVFFVLGLVIYYIAQAILRIGLQHYITRAFYGHDEALGRQAQRASEHARELAKQDGDAGGGGGGLFAQARRDLGSTKAERAAKTAAVATTAATAAAAPARRAVEAHDRAEEPPDTVGQPPVRPAPAWQDSPRRSTVQEQLASASAEEEFAWSGSR